VSRFVGIASGSENAVETAESRDYSILIFRDYRLEIQATTAGGADGPGHSDSRFQSETCKKSLQTNLHGLEAKARFKD
jgi:hypothetical protein